MVQIDAGAQLWFAGSARVDAEVRERFLPEGVRAERGEFDEYLNCPKAALVRPLEVAGVRYACLEPGRRWKITAAGC